MAYNDEVPRVRHSLPLAFLFATILTLPNVAGATADERVQVPPECQTVSTAFVNKTFGGGFSFDHGSSVTLRKPGRRPTKVISCDWKGSNLVVDPNDSVGYIIEQLPYTLTSAEYLKLHGSGPYPSTPLKGLGDWAYTFSFGGRHIEFGLGRKFISIGAPPTASVAAVLRLAHLVANASK